MDYTKSNLTREEVIRQLESLVDNSISFHQEAGDIWEQDVKALEYAISVLKEGET